MVDQSWFEMHDVRKRHLNSAVWIPLRASRDLIRDGEFGRIGHQEEFFGAGSVAVPLDARSDAEQLGWVDVGVSHNHGPYVDKDGYNPADTFRLYRGGFTGLHLVLEQRGTSRDPSEWHLHHDLVLGLGLKREGDKWLALDEGYLEVARLSRNDEGRPNLIEIRAEHLKDFLAAREMALYVTSYRSRRIIAASASRISWPNSPYEVEKPNDRWEGRVTEIHEGGFNPFGSKTAVLHVRNKSVDIDDDVPSLPHPAEGEFESESWEVEAQGRKLYLIQGELWKEEWVEPSTKSPRIRGDKVPSMVRFIVDTEGQQLGEEELRQGGRWLWFRPEVIMALAHRRGGHLSWFTRDTGSVAGAPGRGVHFGVNTVGLVNVYAKDVAQLPEWQQRIWVGHNIGPDGGVSTELLASQVQAEPASTQAPEACLGRALEALRDVTLDVFGVPIVRNHEQLEEIIERAHRFRAADKHGLFALAKDLARLTADAIDAAPIHGALSLKKDDKRGSLKSMEQLLATRVDASTARTTMGPLVGIYELRHADAHLPRSEVGEALALAGVESGLPYVHQGYLLLHQCVSSLVDMVSILRKPPLA